MLLQARHRPRRPTVGMSDYVLLVILDPHSKGLLVARKTCPPQQARGLLQGTGRVVDGRSGREQNILVELFEVPRKRLVFPEVVAVPVLADRHIFVLDFSTQAVPPLIAVPASIVPEKSLVSQANLTRPSLRLVPLHFSLRGLRKASFAVRYRRFLV